MSKPLFCCLIVSFVASSLQAENFEVEKLRNWHQWRGPLATGVAPHGNPPIEWSEAKNIKWKVEVPGRGSASPVVWGDRIFVLTAIKTEHAATDEPGTAGAANDSPFRLAAADVGSASSSTSEAGQGRTLVAQRDDQRNRGQRESGNDGGRRGFGEFGRGGRGGSGFGGRGEKPSSVHQFVVLCIDRKTGDTIWQRTAHESVPHEGHHQTGSFASASPITDGKHLWASFGSRGVYCYDLDGNPKWSKDLGDMSIRNGFGEGASPALFGDTLVLTWDHEGDSFIIALDANTGNEKWRKPREEVTTWATPLIAKGGGRTQVITSGTNRVRSYDLKNGDLIWECGGLGSNPIACPIVYDGLAIAMTGHHDPAGVAVPMTAKGDVTGTDQIAWQIESTTPYVSSPLLYDDTIYFVKSRNAILSSVAAKTGKTIINQKRLPEMDSLYASPVGAGGHVYLSSREGATVVLKHGPEFQIVATNMLDEPIDASPAIVGDELYVRGEGHLYCISEN